MEAQMARFQQQFAIQYTIDGFESIARAFGGIPGRKSLIWVTGSFPFLLDKPGDPPSSRSFQPELSRAFELLNDASISVYPIDARGLVVALPDASTRMRINARNPGQMTRARLDSHTDTITTMQSFAEMTGGRAFYNTNDLERAFQRAADDSSSYYLLGYYRNVSDDKPGWRKLHLKVKRGGTNVRARSGYFVYAKNKGPAPHSDMQQAVQSPLDFTGVPIAVRWEADQQASNGANGGGPSADSSVNGSTASAASSNVKKKVRFELEVERNGIDVDNSDQNHMSFEVLAVARKPTGETAAQTSQTVDGHLKPETVAKIQASGITYRNQLEVEPGEYSVRFVVRDIISGRIGTVSAPLEVK
jgi:hypothetical protein